MAELGIVCPKCGSELYSDYYEPTESRIFDFDSIFVEAHCEECSWRGEVGRKFIAEQYYWDEENGEVYKIGF